MPDDSDPLPPGRDPPAVPEPAPPGGATWASLGRALAPLQWDWPGWLPRGFLTLLASAPGAGKSLLCLRLAACYLDGRPWPDGAPFTAGRGLVLWCESEAGHALNLDRARRWGLDLDRIVTPLDRPLHNFHFHDLEHQYALVRHARRPEIRLVVLDSLRGMNVRRAGRGLTHAVATLADIARAVDKPFLLTHHLRKRTALDADGRLTLDRLRGSGLIAQPARLIWALDVPDLADPAHLRLSVIKSNLAPAPPPLGMRVDDAGLHFGPPPEPPAAYGELDRAVELLRAILAERPLPFREVQAEYLAAGLGEKTIRRAKQVLGISSTKMPGTGEWRWSLPHKK